MQVIISLYSVYLFTKPTLNLHFVQDVLFDLADIHIISKDTFMFLKILVNLTIIVCNHAHWTVLALSMMLFALYYLFDMHIRCFNSFPYLNFQFVVLLALGATLLVLSRMSFTIYLLRKLVAWLLLFSLKAKFVFTLSAFNHMHIFGGE